MNVKGPMQHQHPASEQVLFSAFLAAASGSVDAYTYLLHGKVFASLQTGNLISLGMRIGEGDFQQIPKYILPILFFVFGTVFTRWLQSVIQTDRNLRKILLLVLEMVLLCFVGLFSSKLPNILFNSVLSISTAIQLLEFQRLKGKPFTTIMMTGNLKTIAVSFYDGFIEKRKESRYEFFDMLIVLFGFITGAIFGSFLAPITGNHTIYLTVIYLIVPFFILLRKRIRKHSSQMISK